MSSDLLLEEIQENAKGFTGKFLTKQLESTKDVKEKINSIVLAEHVKLNSLRRQHELVNKLKAEMPARIAEIEKQIKNLESDKKLVEEKLISQMNEVEKLEANKDKLTKQFEDVISRLHAKKADEAFSIIQREYVWELITKIVELRKGLGPYVGMSEGGSGNTEKNQRDIEYLTLRIEQNDSLLKSAERQLEELIESRNHG